MTPMLMHDADIFMVIETKLVDSFPVSQFNAEGFTRHLDQIEIKKGRGITLYIGNYIIT